MIVPDFLKNSALKHKNKIAVIHDKKSLSYGELNCLSDNSATSLLKEGVQKGDRVIIFMDNSIEYLIAYFAILKAGAVSVARDTKLVSREFLNVCNDCTPKVIIADDKNYPRIQKILNTAKDEIKLLSINKISSDLKTDPFNGPNCLETDLAMIIYTSGTTGKPKGEMLSHMNLSANADSIIKYLHLTGNEKVMVVLPFFYSYGNSLLTTHIKIGGTLVINNRFLFPNVVLENMIAEEVTGFVGVPSSFSILIKKSSIREYHFLNFCRS